MYTQLPAATLSKIKGSERITVIFVKHFNVLERKNMYKVSVHTYEGKQNTIHRNTLLSVQSFVAHTLADMRKKFKDLAKKDGLNLSFHYL